MDIWAIYFKLGLDHITDLGGYDHMLFLLAACGAYPWVEWRRLAVLVTAFTLGHSLTLGLSVLAAPLLPADWVEFLIPVTILLAALQNLVHAPEQGSRWLQYGTVLAFGLIHGMGFSNYLRGLLGMEGEVAIPLLSFNLGLEVGQLLIVAVAVSILSLASGILNLQRRDMRIFISGAVVALSVAMIVEKWPG